MKVHWTETARAHLAAIHQHIRQDSAEFAVRMVDRLTRRSQQIAVFPVSGRKVSEYELEELREVIEGPYRIIYWVGPQQIDVIAVIHGARNLEGIAKRGGLPLGDDYGTSEG